MTPTKRKLAEWQRKIANGKRKQAEAVQLEKEEVWRRLSDTGLTPLEIEVKKARFSRLNVQWTMEPIIMGDNYTSPDLLQDIAKQIQKEIDEEVLRTIKFTSVIDEEIEKQTIVKLNK